jgi:hypothetical protein
MFQKRHTMRNSTRMFVSLCFDLTYNLHTTRTKDCMCYYRIQGTWGSRRLQDHGTRRRSFSSREYPAIE